MIRLLLSWLYRRLYPAGEALRASEARYADLFARVPDGVYETLPDGTVVAANPALVRMLGYASEEDMKAAGGAARLYVNPELREQARRQLESEGEIRNTELELYRKDGGVVTVLENAHVVRDRRGRVQSFQGTLTDITDRKAVLVEVQRARDAALEASRLKTQFLANVSHELRTPLNGVLAMAQVLGESTLPREQQECVTTIEHSASFLLDLINDILDFASIEAGKLRLEDGIFRIRDLVEETAAVVAPRAAAAGLTILTDIDPALPELVRGDGSRLRQVLHNLAVNAVKFTAEGEVVLWARVDATMPNGVRFEVRDTGIGIASEAQELIFEPFSQADGSTRRRFGGTGLGLAIARQIATNMKGRLTVDSRQGGGATFTCVVPLPPAPGCRVAPARKLAGLCGKRVLVIEPRDGVRELIGEWLRRWGAEPGLYTSAGEELDCAGAHLVVADEAEAERCRHLAAGGAPLVILAPPRAADRNGALCVNRPVRELSLLDALLRAGAEKVKDPEPEPLAKLAQAVGPKRRAIAGRRVLAAEDNPVNQLVIRKLTERLGYTIDVVGSGREAIDAVSRGGYSVVLMDCQMPEMDGFEATAAIRALPDGFGAVPIVAVTAHALPGDREQCLARGMDDYLTKPILMDDLARLLERWIAAREAPGLGRQNP